MNMKFGIKSMTNTFDDKFISKLDKWKRKVAVQGMSKRLRLLIKEDLKTLEGKK